MTDDIVERLRVLNHHAKKLAENESLSDLHRDAFMRCEDLTWLAADRIEKLLEDTERLRKERDEARREAMSERFCGQCGSTFRLDKNMPFPHSVCGECEKNKP